MALVTCPCGKRLKAGAEAAGKRVRCPACGAVIEVPQEAGPPGAADEITLAPEEPRAQAPVSAPVPEAVSGRPRGPDLPGSAEEAEAFSFWSALARAPVYPFRGIGWVILITGTPLFTALTAAIPVVVVIPFFAGVALTLLVFLFLGGFYWSYLFSIVSESLMGKDTPPGWPQFGRDEIILPFLRLIAASFVAGLPAGIAGWQGAPPGAVLALFGAGMFYMPMAIACIAIYGTVRAINPLLVFRAIIRMPVHYLATLVALALGLGAYQLTQQVLFASSPLLAFVAAWFVILYFGMVLMRMLGALCRAHRDEF